jgi:hypothetical protein
MARQFQCPYCGTRNEFGHRFCVGCHVTFYYTCTKCNSAVDPSFAFCPNCSTSLDWAVKPRANLLQPPHTIRPKSPIKHKVAIILAVVVLILAVTIVAYVTNQFSIRQPLAFEGYDTVQEPSAEPEQYVTAPPNSQYNSAPPNRVGPDESFQLINNTNAVDTSFQELKAFISADETDQAMYIPNVRMCGHFAETLHNNAEQAGIKSAVVIVEFTDGTLHALNAFQTTDMGLVYIDCTGVRRNPSDLEDWLYRLVHPFGQDRMAYVVKSKEYGTIPLENAESAQYSYYTGYSKGWMMDGYSYFSQPAIVHSIKIYW